MNEDSAPVTRRRKRLMWRTIPLFLSALGLWGLAGCFYLPTPECPARDGGKDYREFLGGERSAKPIRPGFATRTSVIALLGHPRYMSDDGDDVAYQYETVHGALVYPLCFRKVSAAGRMYGVRLHFDDKGMLACWTIVHADRPIFLPWYSLLLQEDVVRLLNEHGPKLIPATQP